MDTLTMHELSELLTSVTPEPYKTTRAAKACIAKLTRDLATSEAALTAERSKVSSLQSDITTSNQTLAHREEALTTANTSIDQHSKQMTILKAAANERQRKLAASHKTICQLSEFGQHDKSRLVELTCYNQRLLQLNSTHQLHLRQAEATEKRRLVGAADPKRPCQPERHQQQQQ